MKLCSRLLPAAKRYECQHDFTKAISDFDKTIELDPTYAEAYNNRGVIYCAKKEYGKALLDLHRAKQLGYPVNPEFLKALKDAFLFKSSISSF